METLPDHLKIHFTRDGSPTLEWQREDGYAEPMHHSAGALSESFYIYHAALEEVVERGWPPRILSLGLGLGYNELIAIGLLHQARVENWSLWSFETSDFLRLGFTTWLTDQPSVLDLVYNQVLKGVSGRLDLNAAELKVAARRAFDQGHFNLRGHFPNDSQGLEGVTCVFYDAFSKQMDPDLWDESDLKEALRKVIDCRCLLATYAAIGSLKRALKALGFRLRLKKGFFGRRESTLAIRE